MLSRRRIVASLKLLLGVGLCAFLVHRLDLQQAISLLSAEHWQLYLVSFICFGVSRIGEAIRLYMLVPNQALTARATLKTTVISTFFNNCTATVVGDGYRAMQIQTVLKNLPQALTVVLTDRLVGFVCLLALILYFLLLQHEIWLAVPAFALNFGSVLPAGIVTMVVGAVVVAGAILISAKVRAAARESLGKMQVVLRTTTKPIWLSAALLSISAQIILAFMVYVLLLAFKQPVTFQQTLFVMLIVYVAAFVPISIGSLGVREGLMAALLPLFGVSVTAAVAAAFVSRFIMYVYAVGGGLWFAVERGKHDD